jgi:hypothetical protein
LAELAAPIPYGFIAKTDASFSHHLLDVAVAEAETEIEPDTMADDLCREPVAFIWVDCWCVHGANVPHHIVDVQTSRFI